WRNDGFLVARSPYQWPMYGRDCAVERFPPPLKLSSHATANSREDTMRIMIITGPSLNLPGGREPHIYGATTLEAIKASCEAFAAFAGAQLSFHQSNHEGELVELIQSARSKADP